MKWGLGPIPNPQSKANLQVLLLHIGRLGLQYEACNLEIRETTLFNL